MEERRRAADEQLGYLTGKMEELGELLKGHLTSDTIQLGVIHEKLDKLEDKVSEKFTTVETVFRVFKWLGAVIVAVLTLKFGDVGELIASMFR